ncbi:MAG: presenilin family intramembrane aspartyl protease [Candidatus Woesearchaeota archaeon]|nr:presenilin family intramembrane aspartyl protease [Candidatus Woesearchaeota archaeon]
MKHPVQTTVLLIFLFVVAQLVGIALVFLNIKDIAVVDGTPEVVHDTTALGERPELEGGGSFLFILLGVGIGTSLLLVLIKFKLFWLWKVWFFLAVWFSMTVSFGVLVPVLVAYALALGLAAWKVLRPNVVVHNVTEMFIYAGITVLIAPLFDLPWMIVLLAAISIYDMIAVWQSKHMVKMAKAQTKANMFAGLYVAKAMKPRKRVVKKRLEAPKLTKKGEYAILGGGDIAFPLLFSGVVLVWLIESGVAPLGALCQVLLITITTTIALTCLFLYSKKGKFYPAMPFLSAGCLLGFGLILLL